MVRYNCIIIEDEPLALERITNYVNKLPALNLKGTFDNALEGLSYLQTHDVEILFLDINMDELSGIELLESAHITGQVIITTAYQQYALKGYELNVTDYLLKPYTLNRFIQAVDKALENLSKSHAEPDHDYIFVKTENRLEKIVTADILYIEGMRDYRRIHTTSKNVMTLQSFTDLEGLLPASRVCRIHKSYMVGVKWIEAIERGRVIICDQRLPISATYKDRFHDIISSSR
jgi:two-component system, LytTR family, response regulator